MTIRELMDLEKKLLIIQSKMMKDIDFNEKILLEELLKRIGKITDRALGEILKKDTEYDFLSEEIDDGVLNYILGNVSQNKTYDRLMSMDTTQFEKEIPS